MVAKRDFTDRFLKSIKPAEMGKRVVIYDAQIPGFGIRVTDHCTDDNKGAFVLITRFPGSSNPAPRRIGDYPAMSLAKAREIAREWREDIGQGIDPKVKEADRLREEQRRRADTFAAVFGSYADDCLSTLRTGEAVKAAVRNPASRRERTNPRAAQGSADRRQSRSRVLENLLWLGSRSRADRGVARLRCQETDEGN
jgi:hypothetical protein